MLPFSVLRHTLWGMIQFCYCANLLYYGVRYFLSDNIFLKRWNKTERTRRTRINLKANHEDLEDTSVYPDPPHTSDMYISTSASLRVLNETVDSIIVVMVTVICCATIPL